MFTRGYTCIRFIPSPSDGRGMWRCPLKKNLNSFSRTTKNSFREGLGLGVRCRPWVLKGELLCSDFTCLLENHEMLLSIWSATSTNFIIVIMIMIIICILLSLYVYVYIVAQHLVLLVHHHRHHHHHHHHHHDSYCYYPLTPLKVKGAAVLRSRSSWWTPLRTSKSSICSWSKVLRPSERGNMTVL